MIYLNKKVTANFRPYLQNTKKNFVLSIIEHSTFQNTLTDHNFEVSYETTPLNKIEIPYTSSISTENLSFTYFLIGFFGNTIELLVMTLGYSELFCL